ncbi:MAG: hypothetical protein WDZ41_00540, partial [Candidatus Babeliales bacterium]
MKRLLHYIFLFIHFFIIFNVNSQFPDEFLNNNNFKSQGIIDIYRDILDSFNQKKGIAKSIVRVLDDYLHQQELSFVQAAFSLTIDQCRLIEENLDDASKIIQLIEQLYPKEALNEIESCKNLINDYEIELRKIFSKEDIKSNRPDAASPNAPNAIVGKNVCDLTQVLALLAAIKKRILLLEEIICNKFNQTFTILEEILDCCQSTFTVLDEIEIDIFDTQTILCEKFFETWTILDNLQITASVDLSTVFTVLDEILDCCQSTFT